MAEEVDVLLHLEALVKLDMWTIKVRVLSLDQRAIIFDVTRTRETPSLYVIPLSE